MCGIAGFVGQENSEILRGMADAMRHRGPDGEGYFFCNNNRVSLAHRRLSITDIAGGDQPMWNEDDSVGIVFNGEIYNHLELRDELMRKGHIFKSDHSDTEVLIHGYEEWGSELLIRLNGMFAFCIYDKRQKQLFFARDRFGKKPLYYTIFDQQLVFASELKALITHPAVKREISPISLRKYFGYGFIPAPYTLYKNISKLPGGHFMIYRLEQAKAIVSSYWQFRIIPDNSYARKSEDSLAEELRNILTSAVKRRMIADVPVGIFLSGGIDSSAILACASSGEPSDRIRTFSIGFREKAFDESHVARAMANFFASDHTEEIFGIDCAKLVAEHVLEMLDEPMGDSSILPTYLLSQFAKQSVTVALGGDGGDELFAGYAPFRALKAAELYCYMLPKALRTFILASVNRLPVSEGYLSFDFKLKRTLQGLEYPSSVWNPVWLSPLMADEISELMNMPVDWSEVYGDAIHAWHSSDAEDLIGKSIEFYGKFYLQDSVLTKVDRASMMVGLEVRAPFLDNEVVEFSTRLPSNLKHHRGVSKYLLKKAMKGILPDDLLARPKKGFGIPLTNWLKTWPITTSDQSNFNRQFVLKMNKQHSSGSRDNRLFLWNWIVLNKYISSIT
ncbi:asparagine synthase (glutamine-hydrolyzing) [Methylomonas sp. EbA]|uniref:asparagine synthase (glutamine-hydrolyzing) n=2 Tax=Methylomonas albis TaxID=1854563 RepID=A0ABR9D0R7_9GAMM|nr:asparagine synthase (glutamine-hydrolyzing) [Methylomonas albis]